MSFSTMYSIAKGRPKIKDGALRCGNNTIIFHMLERVHRRNAPFQR